MANELSDADVFGTQQQKELSDADVFGLPQPQAAPIIPRSGAQMDVAEIRQGQPFAPAPPQNEVVANLEREQPILTHAAQAAVETVKGFIPQSVGQAIGMFFPPSTAVEDVKRGGQMLGDVLFGGKGVNESAAERFPETQILTEAEKTPPYSKERFKAGFDVLAQLGMAAALGRQVPLREILFPEEAAAIPKSEVPPVQPRPIETEAAAKEVTSASEKPSTESVPIPEVRENVGERAPLRQQGEVADARQTVETQPAEVGQEVSREIPGAQFEQPVTTEGKAGEPVREEIQKAVQEGQQQGEVRNAVLSEQAPSVQPAGAGEETVGIGGQLFASEDVPFNLRGEEPPVGVSEEGTARAKAQAAAEQARAQPELKGMPEAERATIAGKTRETAEERALRQEYERSTLEDFEQHMARGGDELVDAIKQLGGVKATSPHFKDLTESFNKKAGFSKLVSGEKIKYSDIFRKDAINDDALVQQLREKGFDIENAGQLADMLDTRFRTGKKVWGMEARGQALEEASFGRTPLSSLGITAENPGIAPKIIRSIQTAADVLRGMTGTRPPSALEPPRLNLSNGGVRPPPPDSVFSPNTPPGSDPVPIYATRINNVFKRWWEKFWPRDLAVQKVVPNSPVITEHQRILKTQLDYMENFSKQSWWQALRGRWNDELIELEDRVVKDYRAQIERGIPRSEAYESAVSKAPQFFQDIVRYRESRVPIEQAAAKELGVEPPSYTGDPYIARLTNEEGKDVVDLHPRIGSLGKQIRTTIGSFDNSRVHATMKDGILQGTQYEPVARSVWLRELNSIRLEATANLVRALKDNGVLFDSKADAYAASPKGRITMVRGIGGVNYWARTPEEAVFLQQNISTVPHSPLGRLQQLANTYVRNPSLINPLPHVTKNMFFKYALARVGNQKFFRQDVPEFVGAKPSELKARFDKVMPFVETGERLPQLTAKEVGTWTEKTLTSGLKINNVSSNFIFSKADPAMRYGLWKSYVRKGMSDQEAANHVWIDLIRYDANSGGMNFWKSIPFNFFVPWRTGTYVTLAKQITAHPIRSLLFIGAIEYLRELRYRKSGRWTHLPVDYIDAPLAETIDASSKIHDFASARTAAQASGATVATTLLFGPGGGQAPSTIADVMNLVRGDPEQKARVINMFWGLSQIYNLPRDFNAYQKDGDPKHLVDLMMSVSMSEHSALKYEPRRLMKWLPEWMPGLQKSELVKRAEAMRAIVEERRTKARSTFEARHGVSATFERTPEEQQIEELERASGGGTTGRGR